MGSRQVLCVLCGLLDLLDLLDLRVWEGRRTMAGLRLRRPERRSCLDLLLRALLALFELGSLHLDLALDFLADDQLSALLFNFRQSNQ